jgi:hypothetical protein
MTFTYDNTDLSTDLAKVRLMIYDVTSTSPLLTDEEINRYITLFPDLFEAGAGCAEAIAAKLGRQVDRSVLGASDTISRTAEFYMDLAERLRTQASSSGVEVFAGGRTISGKIALAEDTDAIQPSFSRGMHDSPGTDKESDPRFEGESL